MKLLEPVAIGARTAPNRVLFGPHVTNLGDGRALSERHVAYYRRRAEGGVGVVVVEESAVHLSDWPYERSPLASSARVGWGAIADACHPFGTLVLAALGHSGGQGSSAYSQRELWAPSGVPEVNTREVPKVMEPADIDAVLAGFVDAAGAAVAAGCDGVEINVGQYSLLRQFLSGLTNQRDDEWGTDRAKLVRDVLAAVRAEIGDAVLAVRLSCDELAPWAGLVPEAAADLAADLVGAGGSAHRRAGLHLLDRVDLTRRARAARLQPRPRCEGAGAGARRPRRPGPRVRAGLDGRRGPSRMGRR